MSGFGRNLKITIDVARRDEVRRFFEEGLGCARRSPDASLDLFTFDDGCTAGAFYVPASEALPHEAYERAPWLEFLVDDVSAMEAKLGALGAERVAFQDTTHPYLRVPGGPVFRLAKR